MVNTHNIILLKVQILNLFHKKYENNSQHHSQITKRGVLFQKVKHYVRILILYQQTMSLWGTGTKIYYCIHVLTGCSVTTWQR